MRFFFKNFAVLFELDDGYSDSLSSYGHFEPKYARVASCYKCKYRLQCRETSRWELGEHFETQHGDIN